jgi:hypothetical protein
MPAGDGIETGWGEVGGHRVTEPGVNCEAAGRGVGDKLLEHRGSQIDGRHTLADRCGGQSNVTGASCYIEDIAGRGQGPTEVSTSTHLRYSTEPCSATFPACAS